MLIGLWPNLNACWKAVWRKKNHHVLFAVLSVVWCIESVTFDLNFLAELPSFRLYYRYLERTFLLNFQSLDYYRYLERIPTVRREIIITDELMLKMETNDTSLDKKRCTSFNGAENTHKKEVSFLNLQEKTITVVLNTPDHLYTVSGKPCNS